MPRSNPLLEDRTDAIERVAFLVSEGLKQRQISERLGIAQSVVSQLITAAIKSRILNPNPSLLLNPDDVKRIRARVYLSNLEELLVGYSQKLGLDAVPKLHVCHSDSELDGSNDDPPRKWDAAVADWGRRVGPFVKRLLLDCSRIGITWGRQCRSVVDGIQRLHNEPIRSPVDVVPLWCPRLTDQPEPDEIIFTDPMLLSSNRLAADLNLALNASTKTHHYVLPGFDLIPFKGVGDFEKHLTAEERARERDWLERVTELYLASPAYATVFGEDRDRFADSSDALVWHLDAIITSVGSAGTSRSFGRGSDDYGGIPREFLLNRTVGDVGGMLIPKEEYEANSAKKRTKAARRIVQQFERLRERWMGPHEVHFAHCARRAREEEKPSRKRPGVIALAVGATRAEVILHGLIRRQLVNHLVIDHACAKALKTLIETDPLMKDWPSSGSV